MEIGQQIVIILSILLLVWYFVFSIYNRRHGIATYRWLREGLEYLGEISEESWIGSSSSGAQLIVGEANVPFKRFGIMFMLQPREILPKWLLYLFRGKQDEIVVKATLRKIPKQELFVGRMGNKEIRKLISPDQKTRNRRIESVAGFDIVYKGHHDPLMVERLEGFLAQYQENVLYLSLKKEKPHLELRLARSGLVNEPAETFLFAIQDFAGGD